ncbi:MAG: adenine phosphoribosyltransferase [Oscillospiraceae bacterium]|jgi:adenine phosphoribosyltransferase|nr:adenine phosphoribosyltransferase [Oscillospiraceae bacterium]
MAEKEWPLIWPITVDGTHIELPLVRNAEGFQIYAFDSMGRTDWNKACAKALAAALRSYDFDILLTAESKAIGLAEELSSALGLDKYVVLRKSLKLYMIDPVVIDVKSVTTANPQKFYLGKEQQDLLRGKRVCVLDDVISTGGTLSAIFEMGKMIGFTPTVYACVLTEEIQRSSYENIPVLSLAHIPLPGMSPTM